MAEWPDEQVFEKDAEWMLRMHAKVNREIIIDREKS